jgi:hypothetical protein
MLAVPALGTIRLTELRPEHVEKAKRRWATEPAGRRKKKVLLSPRTVHHSLFNATDGALSGDEAEAHCSQSLRVSRSAPLKATGDASPRLLSSGEVEARVRRFALFLYAHDAAERERYRIPSSVIYVERDA